MNSDIAAIIIALAGSLLVLHRWRQRFRAIGSSLLKPPAYRALFVLALVGALLVSMLPEAAFVLPALDVVGLDLVTILVALELRHYWASVGRLLRMSRCGYILRGNPLLWVYACMGAVIWLRTLKGTMTILPPE